ncbi:hypothetical protein CHCC14437_0612 [Bacillus licheniformis]|nr:hypothetical protein CHCC14437_0612 [Bacillus licheniformis]
MTDRYSSSSVGIKSCSFPFKQYILIERINGFSYTSAIKS